MSPARGLHLSRSSLGIFHNGPGTGWVCNVSAPVKYEATEPATEATDDIRSAKRRSVPKFLRPNRDPAVPVRGNLEIRPVPRGFRRRDTASVDTPVVHPPSLPIGPLDKDPKISKKFSIDLTFFS